MIELINIAQRTTEPQAGFRKGYRTTYTIFTLQAMVQKYLSKRGGRFYCFFIDFSKAFDTEDHYKLLSLLNKTCIGGKLFKILLSMYQKLKSCVRDNQSLTEFFDYNIGTMQGCKLSPILFSLFINDIVCKNWEITAQMESLYHKRFPKYLYCSTLTILQIALTQ